MNIFLIRHGQTAWNDEGRIQGNIDTELDQTGIKQAESAGRRLKAYPITQIFCSDLRRAVQTGEIINNYLHAKLILHPGLREIKYGEWEGKRWEEIRAQYPVWVEKWLGDRINTPAPGGESFAELEKRLEPVALRLKSEPFANVAVISHAGVIKTLTCLLLGLGIENHPKFSFKNGSISIFHYNPETNQTQVVCLNDFSHLEESSV